MKLRLKKNRIFILKVNKYMILEIELFKSYYAPNIRFWKLSNFKILLELI